MRRVSGTEFAVESAFCEHLKLLKRELAPEFSSITVAGPEMSEQDWLRSSRHLGRLDRERDGIDFAPLHPAGVSTSAFFLRWFPAALLRLWRLVRRVDLVHAGHSHDLKRPIEFPALLLALLLGKKTLSVADIDLRHDARMNLETGRWSRATYLRCRWLWDPLRLLQLRFIVRTCSLVMLKGHRLSSELGRGRPNVRDFLDSAYSSELLIGDHALERKVGGLRDPDGLLEVLYFGRLVPYKGVDRCVEAVAAARERVGPNLRLTIFGAGPEEPRLRELVNDLRVAEGVRFMGPVPYGPDFFERLGRCHVLLATPLSADTPRSAMDAFAAGVPILAFDTEYYRTLAEKTGAVELVPWPSLEDLTERLVELAQDKSELVERTRRAAAFAAQNTQEIWLARRAEWTKALFHGRADASLQRDVAYDDPTSRSA
jgi:glycosyltransferase involved in cell wall biosynthesis